MYLHTKLYMRSSSNGLSIIAIKQKAKYRPHTPATFSLSLTHTYTHAQN
jgi:hypothetical protein